MARPKKEESIRRTSNVMVRFSSIEYELVAGYAKDAGYPISTFVRKQALSEKVTVNYNIVADIGEIQKLTAQAAGIGNNLNQIARYFHGGGLASRGMLEELKKCIAEMRRKSRFPICSRWPGRLPMCRSTAMTLMKNSPKLQMPSIPKWRKRAAMQSSLKASCEKQTSRFITLVSISPQNPFTENF